MSVISIGVIWISPSRLQNRPQLAVKPNPFVYRFLSQRIYRVTTCLENLGNLKMSGNLTAVREMSEILLKIRELPGKKSCQGKVA